MMQITWKTTSWYQYLDHGQRDLVEVAMALWERERVLGQQFHDYSFVVFPMAKAFEGFIKKYLYDLEVISEAQYRSVHFRIGKSLNPDLPLKYRVDEWIVEDLNEQCGVVAHGMYAGEQLSQALWQEWRQSRNLLFHYFPAHLHFISLEEAGERLERLGEMMAAALQCPAFVRGIKD
jgi:hypothetical protein